MKSLENFHLRNMELVHKYLNGEMDGAEKLAFEKRLNREEELRDDFEIVEEYLTHNNRLKKKKRKRSVRKLSYDELVELSKKQPKHTFDNFSFDQIRMERKAMVGRDLISYGIGAVALALLMLGMCILLLSYFG